MNEQLPIKFCCLTCEPNKKEEEGFRLSHGYCEKHSKEVLKKFREEILGILPDNK